MAKRAAILCTGTELTSGEIVNTNGAWLGDKLEDLGFQVTTQVLVPDDKAGIMAALDWLKPRADLIIVGGGLGPTSDDKTREAVAEWAGRALLFSEPEWQAMQRLYEQRGLTVRPAHRHQCHFPEDSRLLPNPVGTALGFALDARGARLVVVPGPPRELQGMWETHVVPVLRELAPTKDTELLVWTCLGVTESEAAEVAEEAMKGSGLELGYRASIPYVRVKLWLPLGLDGRERWHEKLERALEPWIVARGADDPLTGLVELLRASKAAVVWDAVTGGRFGSRLAALAEKKRAWPPNLSLVTGQVEPADTAGELRIRFLAGPSPSVFRCEAEGPKGRAGADLEIPFKVPVQSQRGSMYASEWAVQWCLKNLPALIREN